MSPLRSARAALIAAAVVAISACDSLEVEKVQVALLNVPTQEGDDSYFTSPSAIFIEGTGIGLSSTNVGQEGCVVRDVAESGGSLNVEYIDAGAAITARFDGPTANMARTTAEGRIEYETPEGLELAFTPGDVITFEIPGAAGGFPQRVVTARTAEEFTASTITFPASLTDNVPLTWTDIPDTPGSAMFYSIRYSSPGAPTLDREIACVFRDDGSGLIGATLLGEIRQSANREATAQRARITTNRSGAVITHVTSTFQIPVLLTDET